MKYTDMTVSAFQEALAASSPTPGGGTASAISLGHAASLALMVCRLTKGKERWADGWEIANRVEKMAGPLLDHSSDLAQKDSEAFDKVMACFRMPKATGEDKLSRKAAIDAATLFAAEVPYETAKIAVDLLELLPDLARHGNANAVTDVGVAGLLASAAAKGALFNVEINLNSLPPEAGGHIRESLQVLKEASRLYSRQVMDAVRDRMES